MSLMKYIKNTSLIRLASNRLCLAIQKDNDWLLLGEELGYLYLVKDSNPTTIATHSKSLGQFEIKEIWSPTQSAAYTLSYDTAGRELVWKKPKVKDMTIEEIEEKLGYEINIVPSKKEE